MAIMRILIVGAGRAGASFYRALGATHEVTLAHHAAIPFDLEVDLVLLCVPDDAIAEVALGLPPRSNWVVAHVAGSRGLDVLAPHPRVASLHPLAALRTPELGAQRLRGAVFCVEGDDLVREVVDSLGGRIIEVPSARRALYHAAAVAAANHLVALMAQVDVLARSCGLSLSDFAPLAAQALDDVVAVGPAAALTGPATRGDQGTLAAHLIAVPDDERELFATLSARARRLAREATSCTV
jgi:predicted short-subunit dehydrogenase-like oxidoreductase (DUF2520 family)